MRSIGYDIIAAVSLAIVVATGGACAMSSMAVGEAASAPASGLAEAVDTTSTVPKPPAALTLGEAPAPLRTVRVEGGADARAAGARLQRALDDARPGDALELEAGATYAGNFTLRAKPTSAGAWIVVRTSSAALPPAGTR